MPRAYSSTAPSRWPRSHGHVLEEPLMGEFAHRHVQLHLVLGDLQPGREDSTLWGSSAGSPRGSPTSVAPTTSLGQRRQGLTDLGAEEQAAHLAQHPGQRAGELAEHRRQVDAFRKLHAFGQLQAADVERPRLPRLARPPVTPEPIASTTLAATGSQIVCQTGSVRSTHSVRLQLRELLGGTGEAGQGRDVVEPVVGEPACLADGGLLGLVRRPALARGALHRHLAGELPVDGTALPGQQLLQLAEEGCALAECRPSRPEPPEPGPNPKGNCPLMLATVVRGAVREPSDGPATVHDLLRLQRTRQQPDLDWHNVAGWPKPRGVRFLLDIRDEPLSVDECLAFVADPSAGGVDLFLGAVRDDDGGRSVDGAGVLGASHRARAAARRSREEVAAGVPVVAVAAVHRVGKLAIGDAAVIVAVSAVHRGEAFDACRLADRPAQARGPHLEAPDVHRRHGRMGGGVLILPGSRLRTPRRRAESTRWICWCCRSVLGLTKGGSAMEHVVFSAAQDGAGEEFRRVASLEEAVRVVEHLRNDLGITDPSVFALTPVPVAFRTYYRVEVPGRRDEPAEEPANLEPAAEAANLRAAGRRAVDHVEHATLSRRSARTATSDSDFVFDGNADMEVPSMLPEASAIPASRQDQDAGPLAGVLRPLSERACLARSVTGSARSPA